MSNSINVDSLTKKANLYSKDLNAVKREIQKAIVGQEEMIDKILIALLSRGHILLEGVPGLAKTLAIKTLSETINSKFNRVQFTPDLLPADIMGTKIYDHQKSKFYTEKGPIFCNFLHADEINRAPPKVQSALLEAMQERQVSIHGDTFKLEEPFLVLATQNPVETEGTYKLPEAQVDRFALKLLIDYPNKEQEKEIINRYTKGIKIKINKIIDSKKIIEMQNFTEKIYADDKIIDYVVDIIEATRNPEDYNLDIDKYIDYGASPRASLWLILTSKANALINGRGYVIPEDIKYMAKDVLRHRIILNYEAEAEDITTDDIINNILETIKSP